jgi:hypothetical protein
VKNPSRDISIGGDSQITLCYENLYLESVGFDALRVIRESKKQGIQNCPSIEVFSMKFFISHIIRMGVLE